MNFKKIPITAAPVALKDLLMALLFSFIAKEKLGNKITALLGCRYIFIYNSGIAAFYCALEILKQINSAKEVVLPAYTAGSLVTAIKKAGLTPILCDISLSDFNLDTDKLAQVVNNNTLAIVTVHSFGIIYSKIIELKQKFPHCFIIEDCAQSMGSKINGNYVGAQGDISIFSFNRGKNITGYTGGCLSINSANITVKVNEFSVNKIKNNYRDNFLNTIKLFLLYWVINPWIYNIIYPIISLLKEDHLPKDFFVHQLSRFQQEVICRGLSKLEINSRKRYETGREIINKLKNCLGITCPQISAISRPAFNRLPIIFNDLSQRDNIEKELNNAGIETSRMYLKPLHHMFDLGYKQEDFPSAVYLAKHLLTLPVNPLVAAVDLRKIIKVITTTVTKLSTTLL
jgi:dTDP-4-amino-4,6-dideoxygalactose transaminase